MNVAALISLLEEAIDINDRSVFYRNQITTQVHPLFQQIITDYNANNLVLVNNPSLAQIRVFLDESMLRATEQDFEPIGIIIDELAKASKTLQPITGDPDLSVALSENDTLYSQVTTIYNEVLTLIESHGQIAQQRSQFVIGETGSPMFEFATQFDTQLDRDLLLIHILRDTFVTFKEKLESLRAKIVQLMNPPVNLPQEEISEISTLLEQASAITDYVNDVVEVLQDSSSRLTDLGNGLLKGEINVLTDTELDDITLALNTIISASPAESLSKDALLGQLKELAEGFTANPEDPGLSPAITLAGTRRTEAKNSHEEARLQKIAFVALDQFSQKLDAMEGTPEEKDFYSGFRAAIDKFHLVSEFIDSIGNQFESSTHQIWYFLDLILSDPRIKVQLNDDKLPFALLPVRLETRFMTIKHVRDNIVYSSTDDLIRSDADVQGIRSVNLINTLMEASGPKGGQPLQEPPVLEGIPDEHELWVRIYPDAIAIHNHEDPLSQAEIDAALAYWIENWKALGDAKFELGAWRVLCGSCSAQRAAWIVSQTIPTNGPNPNTGTAPLANLTTMPVLPALTPRPASWSAQPHSKVMPERFVVRVYPKNNPWREIVGQKVPSPLPIGLDPTDPYANYLDQYASEINMPSDLRWLTNFEEAEKVGMGIRIPLQGNEASEGFDRLLVLGLKLDLNASAAADELETLFNNHHFSTGLALVPQGTATNNTDEVKSGYTGIEPGYEESFAIELGANLFSTTTSHYGKADGQRLAEALGVDSSVFQHVGNSNRFDIQESMDMSRALWPSTMGYYLKNMFTPALAQNYITDTRTFFSNYVFGRGLIPAFRVKNQPYGVLTSTVYSKWKYSDQFSYESKLFDNVLDKLRKYWKRTYFPELKRVGAPTTLSPSDVLVNILGLHPSSVQFHQRISVGSTLALNIVDFLNAANPSQTTSQIVSASAENQLDSIYKSYLMESFNYFNTPRIFRMAFAKAHRRLNGPVIDTLPLSEKRQIEYLGNGYSNYIEWLENSPISYIKAENFSNPMESPNLPVQPPKALLYLLLRHAWLLEYLDTAHCLLTSVNAVSVDAWHNHELLRMAVENTPEAATEEQKMVLKGFVRAEVEYENELAIEDVMNNLETNQEYLNSGLTPEEFHVYLQTQSRPSVETIAANRFEERLGEYYVDQGQWSYLTSTFSALSNELPVADFIRANINSGLPCYANLRELHGSLTKLKTLPTARLERCLAEHLDTCTYRLDSWLNGLVNKRLLEQRSTTPNGIYLGSYGILMDLKPNTDYPGIHVVNVSPNSWQAAQARLGQRKLLSLTPFGDYPSNTSGTFVTAPAPGKQPATFIYLGEDTATRLIEDPESGKIVAGQRINSNNQGFLLAPSLNHAVAAAIMKAGYKAHEGTATTAETMAVTLTSDRVRTAMYYLDGIRHGQSLGALLGYRFERGLHEYQQAFVPGLDGYIAEIRAKYPLVVSITPGSSANSDAQARNVTDGLKLLQAYAIQPPTWFNGISGSLHNGVTYINDGIKIVEEIEKIKKDLDAIGDLLLSEAIFQVTKGNHERAGSVLQALGYGGLIPEPEIIKTPRQADTFMHRCVVQFSPATANSLWTGVSKRATAEPALNNWLTSQLPSPLDIKIVYGIPANSLTLTLDMNDLGLQPIDLVAIFSSSGGNQSTDATELSKRTILKARTINLLDDTYEITIDYKGRTGLAGTQRNIFELTPILQSLSRIVGNGRMLNPDDFVLPGALSAMASPAGAFNSGALYSRLDTARNSLQTTTTALNTAKNSTPASGFTSGQLNTLRSQLMDAAQFGIPTAIPDSMDSTTVEVRDELVAQATRTLVEMNKRLAAAGPKLTAVNSALNPTPPATVTPAIHKAQVAVLVEVATLLFGRSFKVFTDFTFHNPAEVTTASTYAANNPDFFETSGPFPVESWMSGVARVRPRMGEYYKQMVLAESVRYKPANPLAFEYTKQTVLQFPIINPSPTTPQNTDHWIGMKLPASYQIPLDAISMVIESELTSPALPTCGMVIDEWPEQIPIDRVTTGIAINYDQPSNEAPQAILLAVTPEIKSYWKWDDLMETLNETIEMAQIRACEPDMIQKSALSQVLPALVAQMNGDGSNASPSLDFARNVVSVPNGFDDPINLSTY